MPTHAAMSARPEPSPDDPLATKTDLTAGADIAAARNAELAPLLARVALGDRSAFARLYAVSAPHLFALVLRMLRNRGLAEDVLQDVFTNVWQRAGTYRADLSPPMAWLTGVARNAAISALRRPHLADGPLADDALAQVPDESEAGPLERLVGRRETGRLHQCFGALSGLQRQLLALAYYRGMAHAELSDYLGQPLGTVKTRLRRALQLLKECLDR